MGWVIDLAIIVNSQQSTVNRQQIMFARSRRNLANLFALSMGSILIVFAAIGYYLRVEDELQKFDVFLFGQSKKIAENAQRLLYLQQLQMGEVDISALTNALPMNSELSYIRWYNVNQQLILFYSNNKAASRTLTAAPGYQTLQINSNDQRGKSNTEWIRELTIKVVHNNTLIGYLQIAAPLTTVRSTVDRARFFLALGVPVTLGVIGITGWFLGGLAMQPTRRAYEQLQRFTADASHELRAPVAAVLSNAQVALIPPFDESELRFRLENIVDVTKSMSNLIANLLLLSRHEGNLDASVLKNINLVELVANISNNYQEQATSQNLIFTSQLPEEAITIKAEPDLLKQAIVNLLSNAFKYTPANGSVKLRVFVQSHQAVIQVEDSGIGIPEQDLPNIFERFYRVDTVRSRQTGGFGLGLAIAQQIVQAHQGKITVNSLVGQGSIFQIELPLT
jgi:two-component system, OmpR family, manganese sensing sensor histidine kinase